MIRIDATFFAHDSSNMISNFKLRLYIISHKYQLLEFATFASVLHKDSPKLHVVNLQYLVMKLMNGRGLKLN